MGVVPSVQDLVINYDLIRTVRGISFEVNQGEIVTLTGMNGVGKTTTLYTASGLIKIKSDSVSFCDHNLFGTEPHKILGSSMAYVPEDRRVFPHTTVMGNLQMGTYIRNNASGISEDYDTVFKRLLRLKERRRQAADTLSGDEQQMLAIGRALMGRPKILLLDEPSMGLSPFLVDEIFKTISDVNESGVTALLVGQNAKKALEIADRAYVLETGKTVMPGDTLELADNKEVRKTCLGG